jgi:hypothetical protein
MVHAANGLTWSALANSRNVSIRADSVAAIDAMVWDMVRKMPAWGA